MCDVMILMGSKSDWETMEHCRDTLIELGISCQMHVSSAHRTPERTHTLVQEAEKTGTKVFICAAGMAAHLAGVVSSLTVRPVIGVPMKGGVMDGLDALLSTVQMPGGMPVATVAVGKAGAMNAAILAAQILATTDDALAAKLRANRESDAQKIIKDSEQLNAKATK